MEEKATTKFMLTSNPLGKIALRGVFSNEPCGTQSDEIARAKYQFNLEKIYLDNETLYTSIYKNYYKS